MGDAVRQRDYPGSRPVSDLHADAVSTLRALPPGPVRDRFLDHLAAYPGGVYRSCVPAHVTASTLVLSADRSQVLLTLHTKARQWFQFGGHCEAGDRTLVGAAHREATEESGLVLTLHPTPVHLDEHPVPFCRPGNEPGTGAGLAPTRHLDVRFLAIAEPDAAHTVSAESLDLRWWPIDGLPGADPSLSALVVAALDVALDIG